MRSRTLLFTLFTLLTSVLLLTGCLFPSGSEVPPDHSMVGAADITLGWIARLPRIDYVENSTNPEREGWPAPGDRVTWRGQVKNWTEQELRNVSYRWLLDGQVVKEGEADLAPGSFTAVNFEWDWTFQRHELELVMEWEGESGMLEERRRIYTDALSVGFYVERSFYDYFREHQHRIGKDSYSFEDYARRHMEEMNRLMAEAIYENTPQGALDRVRLDRITIVEDGGLPVGPGGSATHRPNMDDRSVDMMWGFPASNIQYYREFVERLGPEHGFWGLFDLNGSLLHELGHARYLIDVYQYDVYHDVKKDEIQILENGHSVVNTELMPASPAIYNGEEGWLVHRTSEMGLMNAQYDSLDRYSTMALNLIAGHRAVAGNYNGPANIGEFATDLPSQNRMVIEDMDGNPIPDANFSLYRSEPAVGGSYSRVFDNQPDLQLRTDASGAVQVGRNPFSEPGELNYSGNSSGSNLVAIVRVEKAGRVAYGFLEHFRFNLEYWRGNRSLGEHTLQISLADTAGVFD